MQEIPLNDRVVILPDEPVIKSTIIVPIFDQKPTIGKVISVGPGRKTKNNIRIPTELKANDKVLFNPGTGIDVILKGTQYIIMHEDEVIGVVVE